MIFFKFLHILPILFSIIFSTLSSRIQKTTAHLPILEGNAVYDLSIPANRSFVDQHGRRNYIHSKT